MCIALGYFLNQGSLYALPFAVPTYVGNALPERARRLLQRAFNPLPVKKNTFLRHFHFPYTIRQYRRIRRGGRKTKLFFKNILRANFAPPPKKNLPSNFKGRAKTVFIVNYFRFGIILNVKEHCTNYTIKSWKGYQG